ncbi:Osmosensitive K+ channel histidine kinase KdpD [Klebsiella grimontii]|uniref:Osmosensitive K+ channel histidine kinase KdpD n=1 Tax=Klebsiella grimontii TaxID=2058152 RepID=A0A7H4P7S2_9ENTR|nr:Osmosensitive K+ channel histidine kinase KdpD [Klebsiella grimontii]
MLEGLCTLPQRRLSHRGRYVKEFDLDGALARRPALILVDELAHSNAPGSRHPKRWQDVEELLEAGIDVFTTVNVQHLESLNDVVSGITGVQVRETVPDPFFDAADDVVLVDLPPDDLRQRLNEGKVYIGGQAERAIENFFRKGNLIALRELALRRTADRVDEQMRAWRESSGTGKSLAHPRRHFALHRPQHRQRKAGSRRCPPRGQAGERLACGVCGNPLSASPAGSETAGDPRRAQAGSGTGGGNRDPRRSF